MKKHLLLLVLFLGGIGIIQNALDQTEFEDESVVKVEEKTSSEEKAETVEILKSPVDDSIGIVRYFYNKDDDISGTVTKKTNDPVLGWIVTVSNDSGIATTYQSLSEVSVELNATVKQGDKIGVSGENIYESDLKNHLHFILEKDDVVLNPETYIGKEISAIK